MNYSQDDIIKLISECVETPNSSCIEILRNILEATDDPKVRRIISLAFIDIGDPVVLPTLIKVINQKGTYKGRVTTVYACEGFDCTSYLNLFFNLALYDTGFITIHALEIIGRMDFDKINYSLASHINILNIFISDCEDAPKVELLKELLRFLKSKERINRQEDDTYYAYKKLDIF